ncbi:MAG: peptidase, partial [Lactobacillus crispatus]|nr:peptidase [Lactobacillus crispatus]
MFFIAIDITYVASEHTSHVKLVDNDNKTIQDTPVTGKTGETANVSVTVPKGWQLVSGQELPTQISFNAEGHPDVVVQIEHKTIKVTPDNPKENGTVLPDNPSVHFNGVSHDDLNKTVTREVTITDPTGKKSTTTQTVTFTRGATVDEVTNKVTYDDWSEGGKHTFDKVDVPTVPGYTASQNEVPATKVTSDTTNQTIDISYTANSQTTHINYVDDDGKIVHTTTITGKTGDTVNLNLTVPDKYQLADGQQLPTT